MLLGNQTITVTEYTGTDHYDQKVMIYPNPFSGTLRIQCTEPIEYIGEYNLQGQLIIQHLPGEPLFDLPGTGNLPKGPLVLKVLSGGETTGHPLIRQ